MKLLFVLFSSFLLLIGCEAPRNNPLDPQSGNAANAVLEGTVQTFSLPYTSIEDVSAYWEPGNVLMKTDNAGKFLINNISPANGYLILSKEGYRTDSIFIDWGSSKKVNKQINLNKLPELDSLSIYTVVLNQFSSLQNYQLFVRARINDKDNDIDSVFIRNEELELFKALDFNVATKMYQTVISAEELQITDIEETIGLQFNIVVEDIFEKEFVAGGDKITRVIKEGASTISPNSDSTSGGNPYFVWTKHRVGYSFKYMIEVYTKDFVNPQLVGKIENIPPTFTQMQSNLNLPPGEYFWVIWVIDQFNNSFRSTPSTIIVQ